MVLTDKQSKGLDLAIQRFRDKEKYTVIAGYAGTGKSTLVKFIVNALLNEGVKKRDIVFCSYTGKATLVLQQKGNDNAMTLHKLLYDSFPRPDGSFYRKPKIALGYRVIIVDECSMMPKEMMALLLSHSGIYCIFTGDPGQLPPVDRNANNHLLDKPDIFLDEIMRQAAESDIIQLSLAIREGKDLKVFKGSDAIVMTYKEFNTGVMQWADQILCATNKTRVALNNQMREILGRGPEPEEGDRLICLRNYDDYCSINGNSLVNGVTGTVKNCYKSFVRVPKFLGNYKDIDTLEGEFFSDDNDYYGNLMMDYKEITTGERCLSNKDIYKISRNRIGRSYIPMEFTYGYAITTHKSQGSEWPKVLVVEERFPFDQEEHQRWLYTAVTRSSEKLVVVLKD